MKDTNKPMAHCVAKAQRLHTATNRGSVFDAQSKTRLMGFLIGTGTGRGRWGVGAVNSLGRVAVMALSFRVDSSRGTSGNYSSQAVELRRA